MLCIDRQSVLRGSRKLRTKFNGGASLRSLRGRLRVAARISRLTVCDTFSRFFTSKYCEFYSTIHEQSGQRCIRLFSFSKRYRSRTNGFGPIKTSSKTCVIAINTLANIEVKLLAFFFKIMTILNVIHK